MNITVFSDLDMVEESLSVAESTGLLKGLHAPTSDVMGRLERLWEHIRTGLKGVYSANEEAMKNILGDLHARVKLALEEAGEHAAELKKLLLERLNVYLKEMVDRMLGLIRPELAVANVSMRLTAVEISQTISLSGSIQASLAQVFQLTSSGEMTVAASYAFDPDL